VAFCPVCNSEWDEGTSECPVCGHDLTGDDEDIVWVVLGSFRDRLTADLAKETLDATEIPAVLFSRSGFFGNIGLTMTPFYGGDPAAFEISVPEEWAEEAMDTLNAVLGDTWRPKES